MNPKKLVLGVLLSVLALPAAAQHSPYAGLERREIKALSQEEIDGYLQGRGMSMALPAELNGYPGPKHVLELASELGLTEDQAAAIQTSFDEMQRDAVVIGKEIVGLERELDLMFGSGAASESDLESILGRLGELQGRLRFTHLRAHLGTKAVLTPQQVAKYDELRGYGSGHAHHH